jgi:hypothetical protein
MKGLNIITIWFGFIMIIMVLLGATMFLFTDFMIDRLFGGKRIGFIIMLFAYAVYRSFRLYYTIKRNKNEE